MKKHLLSFVLLAMTLGSLVAQVDPTTCRKITYTMPYISSEVQLDAFLDDEYSAAEWGLINYTADPTTGVTPVDAAESDISGRFKAVYDTNSVYLFYEVKDDERVFWNPTRGSQWLYDNIEVFFGPTNTRKTDGALTPSDNQFRIHPEYQGLVNEWTGANPPPQIAGTDGFYQETQTGYIYEIKIDWEFIFSEIKKPTQTDEEYKAWVRDTLALIDTMQFETQIADNDDLNAQPNRKYVVTWNCNIRNGNAYKDSRLWGYLKLGAVPNAISSYNKGSVSIYPNPAKDYIYVSGVDFNQFMITNALGQELLSGRNNASASSRIDISTLRPGLYMIHLLENGKMVHSGKLIK